MQIENRQKIGMQVSRNIFLLNMILAVIKFTAGILAHSTVMISDALNNITDSVTTIIVFIGIRMGSKEADDDHPYGHERLESIASIIVGALILFTGVAIFYHAIQALITGTYEQNSPNVALLVIATASVIVKELMYRYTKIIATKIDSEAMLADALNHRADAFASLASIVGIAGVRMGFAFADPLLSLVICLFIFKVAMDTFKEAISKLVDTACDEETVELIKGVILDVEGVLNIDEMMTRMFGSRVYVDVEISVDENLSLKIAHDISEDVHDQVEAKFPKVKHCMVHINPQAKDRNIAATKRL